MRGAARHLMVDDVVVDELNLLHELRHALAEGEQRVDRLVVLVRLGRRLVGLEPHLDEGWGWGWGWGEGWVRVELGLGLGLGLG